jgi:hypothetical protein
MKHYNLPDLFKGEEDFMKFLDEDGIGDIQKEELDIIEERFLNNLYDLCFVYIDGITLIYIIIGEYLDKIERTCYESYLMHFIMCFEGSEYAHNITDMIFKKYTIVKEISTPDKEIQCNNLIIEFNNLLTELTGSAFL